MSSQSKEEKTIDWKDNQIKWEEIIKKEARGYDKGDDLGEVQEIGQEFVVTEKGRISKSKFYLPKVLVAGFDGEVLWFNITEDEAEDNFKRDNPPQMGEYSRYKSASVTQQPDVQSQNQTDSSRSLQDYLPLIEKRHIDKVGTDASYTNTTAGIEDWDSILKKGVKTQDEISVGVVTAVNDDGVIVTSEGAKEEYNFPKKEIQSYNGQEVTLNLIGTRLDHFKVKVPR